MVFLCAGLYAQSPQGFNYQAVARDAAGELVANKSLQIRATIYSGSSGSNLEYQETHGVATNANGLFSLIVGEGSPGSGQFSTLKWGDKNHHLQIEVDAGNGYVVMGKIQLQSVPYALFAANTGSVDDADADSTNELQTLSITGNKISLTDGGSVDLPVDNDNSATNEIQTLGISGNTISLSNGGSVALPVNNDNSATNEIQTLSSSNDTIFLSDGGFVVLSGQTLTAGTGIDITSNTVSAKNKSNIWNAGELQGTSISTDKPTNNDVLQYDGTKWAPSAATGGGSLWKKDGKNVYFDEFNVGINVKKPLFKLHITDSIYGTGNGTIMTQNFLHGGTDGGYINYALRSVVIGHGGGDNTAGAFYSLDDVSATGIARGVYSTADGDGNYNYAVHAVTGENASVQNYGVVAVSEGKGTFNMGVYTVARRNNANTNYGIYASTDSATTQYAGYFNGNVTYTGTLAAASDMKLKRDVKNLSGAVELVKSLQPKSYYFKSTGDAQDIRLSKHKQFGFIAQDLEKTFPNLVHVQKQPKSLKSKEVIEYKGVDYISLIPVLTQAIKEQQEAIELLEQKVEQLQKQIEDEK
jgi:hypothetical protein